MGRTAKIDDIFTIANTTKGGFSTITLASLVFVFLLLGYHGVNNYSEARKIESDEKNEALKCLNKFKQLDCNPEKIQQGSECE